MLGPFSMVIFSLKQEMWKIQRNNKVGLALALYTTHLRSYFILFYYGRPYQIMIKAYS